jgi:hypothetical protein
MSNEVQEAYMKQIAYLEYCVAVLDETAIASGDLEFLQTFLTHAKGYLSKDVTPDTEAVENWDLPENQAMIQRYMVHVEEEVRLFIDEWQQSHPGAAQTTLGVKLQALVDGLDRVPQMVLPYPCSRTERNGST